MNYPNFQCLHYPRRLCRKTWARNNPLLTTVWSEQETADLVNYLYYLRSEISDGSFPPGTFNNLAMYLNRRHLGSVKSRDLALCKFGSVRVFCYSIVCKLNSVLELMDAVAAIDKYNETHNGGPDPSFVHAADDEAFTAYLSTLNSRVNSFYLFE